jgi:YHS domain-containing protein
MSPVEMTKAAEPDDDLQNAERRDTMAVDPVCKKEIDEKAALGGKARYWGKVFFFCEKKCRAAFQRDPQKYVAEQDGEKEPGYDPRMFLGDM